MARLLVLGALLWFGRLMSTTADVAVMLRAALQVPMIWTLATGFVVMSWVSHMTQRVLRAIQLSSSQPTSEARKLEPEATKRSRSPHQTA